MRSGNDTSINSGSHSTLYVSGLRASVLAALLTRVHVYLHPCSQLVSNSVSRDRVISIWSSAPDTHWRSDMTAMWTENEELRNSDKLVASSQAFCPKLCLVRTLVPDRTAFFARWRKIAMCISTPDWKEGILYQVCTFLYFWLVYQASSTEMK